MQGEEVAKDGRVRFRFFKKDILGCLVERRLQEKGQLLQESRREIEY